MKKILLLLTIALVVFVAVYRQRIFLRDPIATVTRDGLKQGNVKVMINYSNDVLMDDGSTDSRRIYLVQHWNQVAQYSMGPLKCFSGLACFTDGEHASGEKVTPLARAKPSQAGVTMTNRRVQFVDETGALVAVGLR